MEVGLPSDEPFKSREFSPATKSQRDSKNERDLPHYCWFEDAGECRQPVEAESSPWLTASKEVMTSVPQPQDEFCKQPVSLGEHSEFQMGTAPANTLVSTW